MTTCALCDDHIYAGELYSGDVETEPVHRWCFYMTLGMSMCTHAMVARQAKGLPTPTSPLFRDPMKPDN